MNKTQAIPLARDVPEASGTVLFVDDEANILAALKRLFRPFGYRILTAESGPKGLEVLEHTRIRQAAT